MNARTQPAPSPHTHPQTDTRADTLVASREHTYGKAQLSYGGPRKAELLLRIWSGGPQEEGPDGKHANARCRVCMSDEASRGAWDLGRVVFRARGIGQSWMRGTKGADGSWVPGLGLPERRSGSGGKGKVQVGAGRRHLLSLGKAVSRAEWVCTGGCGGGRACSVQDPSPAGPWSCASLKTPSPSAWLFLSAPRTPPSRLSQEPRASYSLFLCLRTLTSRDREERRDSKVRSGRELG